MGLRAYLRMLGSEDERDKLKAHYMINIVGLAVMFVVCFLSLQFEKISALSGTLGIVCVALSAGVIYSFRKMWTKHIINIKKQTLTDSKVDEAIKRYSEGYLEYMATESRTVKTSRIIAQIIYGIFLTANLVSSILVLSGINIMQKYLVLTLLILVGLIVVFTFLEALLNGKGLKSWEAAFLEEKEIIDEDIAHSANKTYNKKYSITNDISQIEQSKYLYPTKEVRQKEEQRVKFNKSMSVIYLVGIIALGIIAAIISGNVNGAKNIAVPITLLTVIVLGISWAVRDSICKNLHKKDQLKILNEDKEKNAEMIKLHRLRTRHDRRWNKAYIIFTVVSLLLFIAVSSLLSAIGINSVIVNDITLLLFLCIPVGLIAVTVFCVKAYGRMRLEMMGIEKGLDSENRIE